MRNSFSEYHSLSEGDLISIWNECIFAFDTNVLLNFYRYSIGTIEELKASIQNYVQRVWIPYNVGFEFYENRRIVINDQLKNYHENYKIFGHLLENFSSNNGHPFISKELLIELRQINDKLILEFNAGKKKLTSLLSEKDWILETIEDLFCDKVGPSYSEETLCNLYIEGEKRFCNNIPPGYKDSYKGGARAFGDFIIWKQLIDKSIDKKKPLIFITDDVKEDWVVSTKNKNYTPLPALIKEFKHLTGYGYYSYSTANFLKLASKDMRTVVSDEAIKEIELLAPINNELNDSIFRKYFKIEFSLSLLNVNKNKVAQFQENLKGRGYDVVILTETNTSITYTVSVMFEDLVRRLYNIITDLSNIYSLKFINFKSDTINYLNDVSQ